MAEEWLEARLAEEDGVTLLGCVHHLDEVADVTAVGPGWEYCLDNLVAAHAGRPLPRFDDDYPAQNGYHADPA